MRWLRTLRSKWHLWPPRSLHRALLGALLLVSLLPLLALGVSFLSLARQQLLTALEAQFYSVLSLKEQQINLWVSGRERDLDLVAHEPDLVAGFQQALIAPDGAPQELAELELVRARLVEILQTNNQFTAFLLLDANAGQVVLAAPPEREGQAYSQHPFFQQALLRPAVQPPVFDVALSLNAPSMVIARPVRGADGAAVGVLAGLVNLADLDQVIQASTGLGQTGTTYMVNKSGFLISAGRLAGGYSYQQRVATEGADNALSGQAGFGRYASLSGRPVFGAYTWLPSLESGLLIEQDVWEATAPLRWLNLVSAVALLFGAFGVVIVSFRVARWITGPVIALTESAQAIAAGNLAHSVSIQRQD